MNCLWLTIQWILAQENIFKKLKLIGKHVLMNPRKFLKFCFFASNIKMVVYSKLSVFLYWSRFYSISHFSQKSFIWWYRDIIKKTDNFLNAVFSIWKSLRVLKKARIKIMPRAIYTHLFFFFCKKFPFLLQKKKLLWSLFSLTN